MHSKSPAPIIAHTCQTQALLVLSVDLTSSRSLTLDSNVPWLGDNVNTSRENYFQQTQKQRGGGKKKKKEKEKKSQRMEHFDWQGRANKGDKSFILPRQRLCSGCHYKALIDNNISTQRRNSSHSQLRNIQRNYREVVDGY